MFPEGHMCSHKVSFSPLKVSSLKKTKHHRQQPIGFQGPLCLSPVPEAHTAHWYGLLKPQQFLKALHRWVMYLLVETGCGLQEDDLLGLHKDTAPKTDQAWREQEGEVHEASSKFSLDLGTCRQEGCGKCHVLAGKS
ncbi:hypothetical protein KIL84_017366 [Mauremys mutica]|uniref:Uncharacterized protein n=1 Tax=Mauremys mutica TaxID=74926 RepID=A0A9D3X4Q0_9SAUR|nr:hypothetical protein KIL84_017366 [Mauremys mutica]